MADCAHLGLAPLDVDLRSDSGVPLPTRCSTKFTTAGVMDISDVVRLGHGNTSSCRGRFRSGNSLELPRLLSELAKAPTPEDPVPVTQFAGQACIDGSKCSIGTAVSETEIFASSIFHSNIMHECCPRSTEKIGFSWRRLQEDVSVFLPVWFRRLALLG